MSELEQLFDAKNDLTRWSAHTVLLAVSGGADSTAMLCLFERVWRTRFPNSRLFAAHANHQLRGEESDADAEFVADLCEKLQIPLISERIRIVRTSEGLERDARFARYEFLQRTASRIGARYLATAHHRDDQAETVLYRILRGTGVAGLAGIAPVHPLTPSLTVVRPLLSASRDEILRYLSEIHQSFRTDSSNVNSDFVRNKIRNELLPFIRSNFDFPVDENLNRLGSLAREASEFIVEEADKLFRTAFLSETRGKSLEIGLNAEILNHSNASDFLLREMFRRIWFLYRLHQQAMTEQTWRRLVRILRSESETHLFPGSVRVEKRGETLRIIVPLS